MRAYILIQAQPGTDVDLVREVAAVPGVARVERVGGPYDLIAQAEVDGGGVPSLIPTIQALRGVLRALASPLIDGSETDRPDLPDEGDVAATGA